MIIVVIGFTVSGYSQIVVIANKSVSVSSVDANTVLGFYKMTKKQWENGNNVVPLDFQDDVAVKNLFYEALGTNVSLMKKAWLKLKLTGEGGAPRALNNEEEMLNVVSSTYGAIGYISKDKVTDQVKVLAEL